MNSNACLASCAVAAASVFVPQAGPSTPQLKQRSIQFDHVVLTEQYFAEGAAVGDFDRDGDLDVVSGPYWYEAPEFTIRHNLYPAVAYPIDVYSFDSFLTFVEDFNADGWDDVFVVAFPGTAAIWYENPRNQSEPWSAHVALIGAGAESPALLDVDGDGETELLCVLQGRLGYAKRVPLAPTAEWQFHTIDDPTSSGPWSTFSHGLGLGDVNGDTRADVLTSSGWFERPASLAGDPPWPFHTVSFGQGGAQMSVQDVNADGRADVLSSWQAHGYGLHWFEQHASAPDPAFEAREILSPLAPSGSGAGAAQFSQLHAVAFGDVDGDGRGDVITGKTFYAHNGTDPGASDPAMLVAFLLRGPASSPHYEPLVIDVDSGVGRQVVARDIDGDNRLDVLTAGKKGVHLFTQR